MPHFAVSDHGSLVLLEPLTAVAKAFLARFGYRPTKVTVSRRDFRELRYAARDFGFAF